MLGLSHEVFDADRATFTRDPARPDIWAANQISAAMERP
jgi:hypothetical protein